MESQKQVSTIKKAYIEITNICNVQCSFCPEVNKPKQSMEPEMFRKTLSKVAPLVEEIALHLMGEPLGHANLEEILSIAEAFGVKVNLTTNGILLRRKISILLKATYLKQVNISLQSYPDNFPNRSLRDYFDDVMSSVDELMEHRPEVYINLRVWNTGTKDKTLDSIFEWLDERYNLDINRTIDVGNIKSKKLIGRLYLHFDSRFDWPSLSAKDYGSEGTCYGLQNQVGILTDGTVVPCCLDKDGIINLGNINDSTLEDIVSSPRAKSIVTGFQNGILTEELCRHCQYIQRFKKKLK